jgi:hypothetical protein
MATGRAWTVLLAAADISSEGPKCPASRVLQGFGALAKPGAKRPTQAGVAGWPDFDPDSAEEPGFIEPYLSAIRSGIRGATVRLRSGPRDGLVQGWRNRGPGSTIWGAKLGSDGAPRRWRPGKEPESGHCLARDSELYCNSCKWPNERIDDYGHYR